MRRHVLLAVLMALAFGPWLIGAWAIGIVALLAVGASDNGATYGGMWFAGADFLAVLALVRYTAASDDKDSLA